MILSDYNRATSKVRMKYLTIFILIWDSLIPSPLWQGGLCCEVHTTDWLNRADWLSWVCELWILQTIIKIPFDVCPQLFIFLERSCDCFSARQSIINKAAWNQCYISLDNGLDDAASWEHHHGKWSSWLRLWTTGGPTGPTASSTWCCHASLNFVI